MAIFFLANLITFKKKFNFLLNFFPSVLGAALLLGPPAAVTLNLQS